MERTIRITGTGKLSVRPDQIKCTINLSGLDPDYEKAVQRSTEESKKVKESIESAGLDAAELKTTSFKVDAEYSYRKSYGTEQRVFDGYRFHHSMKIEFPNDNKILGRVLYALSHCPAEIEFSIGYTVSDIDSVKNKLLEKAVADSKRKAEILAGAAGVRLGQILKIDYSWDEMRIYSTLGSWQNYEEPCSAGAAYDVDFNFDDIDAQDTVTIIWEIESR